MVSKIIRLIEAFNFAVNSYRDIAKIFEEMEIFVKNLSFWKKLLYSIFKTENHKNLGGNLQTNFEGYNLIGHILLWIRTGNIYKWEFWRLHDSIDKFCTYTKFNTRKKGIWLFNIFRFRDPLGFGSVLTTTQVQIFYPETLDSNSKRVYSYWRC